MTLGKGSKLIARDGFTGTPGRWGSLMDVEVTIWKRVVVASRCGRGRTHRLVRVPSQRTQRGSHLNFRQIKEMLERRTITLKSHACLSAPQLTIHPAQGTGHRKEKRCAARKPALDRLALDNSLTMRLAGELELRRVTWDQRRQAVGIATKRRVYVLDPRSVGPETQEQLRRQGHCTRQDSRIQRVAGNPCYVLRDGLLLIPPHRFLDPEHLFGAVGGVVVRSGSLSRPARTANVTACALSTGNAPGRPRHTGQVLRLGMSPKEVLQPQNNFDAVASCT